MSKLKQRIKKFGKIIYIKLKNINRINENLIKMLADFELLLWSRDLFK